MRFTYLLLPAVATCLVSSAFSQTAGQEDKSITMSVDSGGLLTEKPSLSTRVQSVEDRLNRLEKRKGMRSDNPLHGYMNLDFLYWKGKGNDQFYALVGDTPPGAPTPVSGRIQRPEGEWKPGARFEIGFTTCFDWNIGAIWTYYHNEATASKFSTDHSINSVFVNVLATHGKFSYRLNYNTGDLQFASNCYLLKNLVLKPFVDVRGASIKWSDRIRYTGIPATAIGVPADATVTIVHDWWGFGPRVGSGICYQFGKSGLSFFGDVSASLLYGKVHEKEKFSQNATVVAGEQTGPAQTYELRDHFGDLKASLEAMIGASYKWEFCNGKRAICLHAAWETNYWFDQGDYFFSFAGTNISETSESLILYGLNVGLGFAY